MEPRLYGHRLWVLGSVSVAGGKCLGDTQEARSVERRQYSHRVRIVARAGCRLPDVQENQRQRKQRIQRGTRRPVHCHLFAHAPAVTLVFHITVTPSRHCPPPLHYPPHSLPVPQVCHVTTTSCHTPSSSPSLLGRRPRRVMATSGLYPLLHHTFPLFLLLPALPLVHGEEWNVLSTERGVSVAVGI